MSKVLVACKSSQNAIIESPTGTGKTLSLLCPALAFQKQSKSLKRAQQEPEECAEENACKKVNTCVNDGLGKTDDDADDVFMTNTKLISCIPKKVQLKQSPQTSTTRIFFGTRTHKQLSQIVKELRMTSYRPKMAILSSRNQLCLNSKLKNSLNRNEACLQLLETTGCSYMDRSKNLLAYKQFRPGNELELFDIEDLVSAGKRIRGCAYFASRMMATTAELVLCPYNYLIDANIRDSLGIDLKKSIVIIDEAHNIEDSCRSAASMELKDEELQAMVSSLKQARESQDYENIRESVSFVLLLIEALEDWLSRVSDTTWKQGIAAEVKIWSGHEFASIMNESAIRRESIDLVYKSFRDLANDSFDTEILSLKAIHSIKSILRILRHLFFAPEGSDDYQLVVTRNIHSREVEWKYQLGIWCMNSAVTFKSLEIEARSVILASGTLSPLDSFSVELGTEFPNRIEANHVINKSQVFSAVIKTDAKNSSLCGTFKHVETFDYQDSIGSAILETCKLIPFGVLCFVPSYGLVERLHQRWKVTGLYRQLEKEKSIFIEPKGAIDECINEFYRACCENNGALFFAVYRGKLSEGIDFSNDYARGVITVGIPFPHLKNPQIQLKRNYNDKKYKQQGFTGSKWYETQAFRAYNQALGRVIRHARDWGALIMLDSRIEQKQKFLPRWIRDKTKIYSNFHEFLADLNFFVCRQLDK